jgi:hypothetical protein
MNSLGSSLKEVWSDPVWSKVISWAITLTLAGIGAWFFGLWKALWCFLFGKAKRKDAAMPIQNQSPQLAAIKSNNQSPMQSISLATGATVTQNIHYGQPTSESRPRVEFPNASAQIRGTLDEVYQVTFAAFKATVMIYASIVNDSQYVSPSIKCYICQLHIDDTDDGVLSGKASNIHPISGMARSSEHETVFDKGPFPNLCQFNSTPLVKHNHREGWLKFEIKGFNSSLGSTLSVIAIDGADNEYLIGRCSYPWPHQEGVHFVEWNPGPQSTGRRHSNP